MAPSGLYIAVVADGLITYFSTFLYKYNVKKSKKTTLYKYYYNIGI